mgnify:CR=1 FL=1
MTEETFVVDLYIRVSTDRQAKEGDSLEEQESELKKFCEYRNFRIHKIFIERGKSGGNTNRPEYQKLVKDIENSKINAVVVKKLDRLSRSLMDFEQLMIKLQTQDVGFISLRENFDTTTAMGKAMLRVALVFAQLEREQTAERIKDVFAWRAEQGLYNGGTRPFGYDSVSSELIPHKQEKQVVQFMFKTFLEAKSTTIVAKECNAAGYRNRAGSLWDKRQVHKLLNHPVYAGKIRWNDIISQGVHQPLVTEETFQKAQVIFQERTYNRGSKRIKGLLRGFLVCSDCQTPMTPNYTKKKNQTMYYYYRCVSSLNPKPGKPCKNYLRMEDTNQAVLDAILDYTSEPKLAEINQKITQRNDKIRHQLQGVEVEIQGLETKLALVQKKKETYLDSLITKTFSAQERQLINDKINEFGLQEKQIKSDLYKAQFNLAETQDTLVTLDSFKQEMVSFKVNREAMSDTELKDWLKKNVTQIMYSKEALKIHFKLLDLWVG